MDRCGCFKEGGNEWMSGCEGMNEGEKECKMVFLFIKRWGIMFILLEVVYRLFFIVDFKIRES